uniref:Importin subunit beta-1 n=1 Tax=Rhabditophanes sp. KR3021 TaxID=114890 RepID=A0AC35UGY6_9BILA
MAERCPTHEECEDYVNDVLRLYWDLNKNPSAETTGLIGEGDHVLDMLLKAVDSMGENLADDVLSGIVQYSRSVCNLYWQKPGNENNIDICARMFVDTLLV